MLDWHTLQPVRSPFGNDKVDDYNQDSSNLVSTREQQDEALADVEGYYNLLWEDKTQD